MNDPLRDPNFPNRPQHPDYWRLSETALMLDGRTQEGQDAVEATGDLVDVVSVEYVASQRAQAMANELGFGHSDSLLILITAAIMGGIVHGIAFERAGGHR